MSWPSSMPAAGFPPAPPQLRKPGVRIADLLVKVSYKSNAEAVFGSSWLNGPKFGCLLLSDQFPVVRKEHLFRVAGFQRGLRRVLKLRQVIGDERMPRHVVMPLNL